MTSSIRLLITILLVSSTVAHAESPCPELMNDETCLPVLEALPPLAEDGAFCDVEAHRNFLAASKNRSAASRDSTSVESPFDDVNAPAYDAEKCDPTKATVNPSDRPST